MSSGKFSAAAPKRDTKLDNVKLTLQKLNAKYSKSSLTLSNDSSDTDDFKKPSIIENLTVLNKTQDQPLKKSESTPPMFAANNEPQIQQDSITDVVGSAISIASPLHIISSPSLIPGDVEEGSIKEASPYESIGSIDSVKTDSMLDLYNIHSVSSLAESIIPLDQMKQKESDEHSLSNGENSDFSSTSSSSTHPHNENETPWLDILNVKTMDELQVEATTSALGGNFQISLPSHVDANLNITKVDESQPIDFIKKLCLENCDNTGEATEITNSSTTKELQTFEYTYQSGKKAVKKKLGKSVAVQTSSAFERKSQNCKDRIRPKPLVEYTRPTQDLPFLRPLKLPGFLQVKRPSTKILEGAQSTVGSEMADLLLYHLHLTEEFLKREHRVYIANCRAVNLLEKAYQEIAFHGTIESVEEEKKRRRSCNTTAAKEKL